MGKGRPGLKLDECVVAREPIPDLDACEQAAWGASCVLDDWLYVGGYSDACDTQSMAKLGITHVVNAATECSVSCGAETYHIKLKDHCQAPIIDCFEGVCDFIEKARSEGGKVLVHCKRGISRSPALILAYLMVARHLSLDVAVVNRNPANPRKLPSTGAVETLDQMIMPSSMFSSI
eukprot:gene16071-24604_t